MRGISFAATLTVILTLAVILAGAQQSASDSQPKLASALEIVRVPSGERRVVYREQDRFEAPNWSRDGKLLLFNRDGRILRIPVTGGTPGIVDTGFALHCNNDHGISPDGTQFAISDESREGDSVVYVVPFNGGNPRRLTRPASYWHGWSPDGKTLVFIGRREGNVDVYSVPFAGGEETRLTTAKANDDGADYSPDGKYIYFNSDRTGNMQIWRMKPDGAGQEQVFSDHRNNWFPHISPDGKWMIFLSYENGVSGHPPNKSVMLRLMSLKDKKIKVLAKLFGGQGTINVPSWSPDSKRLAFVSYQMIPPDK